LEQNSTCFGPDDGQKTCPKHVELCWLLASGIILIPLASSQHNLYDIPVAVCTVLDSWWWTKKQSKICRGLFQK